MPINSQHMSNKLKMRKEHKMARTRSRIRKMNFQTQERKYEPLSEEHKYIMQTAGYKKELTGRISDEDISRTTGRTLRPQHI